MEPTHILGIYDQEETLLQAFRKMKEEGLEIEDVFTPYPIHEVLEKHGRKSRMTVIGWFYGFFAALGFHRRCWWGYHLFYGGWGGWGGWLGRGGGQRRCLGPKAAHDHRPEGE